MKKVHVMAMVGLMSVLVAGGTAQAAMIYAAGYSTETLYRLDTGAVPATADVVGGFGDDFTEGGLSFNSVGDLYGTFAGSRDALYSISTNTGTATQIGSLGYADVSGIAFSPDDVLFGIDSATNVLVTIDPATGTAAPFGANGNIGVSDVGSVAGMAFAPDGTLYMADSTNQKLYAFDDLAMGDATAREVGDLALSRVTGMTFAMDAGEAKLFVVDSASTSQLYTVDLDTLALDPVAFAVDHPLPARIGGLAAIVPEPGTLVLLGMGGIALMRRQWRS